MLEPDARPELTADVFARLAMELHSAEDLPETVETAAHYALQAVGCDRAGVTLARPGGSAEIAYVTDPVVEQVLRWQVQLGDGPMLHALASSVAVHVSDPATDNRWPMWSRLVTELPIGSVLHAVATLRRYSQATNAKLHHVAQQVVATKR